MFDGAYTSTATGAIQREYETYEWQGHKINYRVEGSGPPILLIHGFGANVNHYRHQFPDLVEAGYKVYAIDLIGFGASDKPSDFEYSMEKFAELCADFIRYADDQQVQQQEPWVIAGNSIGGLCSLATADLLNDEQDEAQQDRVRGCVLFNSSGGMSGFRYEDIPNPLGLLHPMLHFFQNVVLGPDFGGRFFENFKTRENVESILKMNGVYGDTTNVDEDLLEILLKPGDDEGASNVFLKVMGGPPGPTPESILPRLRKVPILALWGGADPWCPATGGMHPGNNFGQYHGGDFRLQVLQGVGHCPHDEAPLLVNQEMISWLKEVIQ